MQVGQQIGFGILGAGMVADYHHQAIEANRELGARLVAVGHYNPDKFEAIQARFGAPCMTEAELLQDPTVEVVCICTPSGQHAAQTLAAAKAGKHVLVEKPMALSLSDANEMIAACHTAGVKLGVVLQRRAEPLFQRVFDAIQGGDLGRLTLALVTMPYYRPQGYFDQADWRGTWALDGGGVLMNQGIHLVDLLIWYLGDPKSVTARAGTLQREIEVEDTLVATLQFPTGALATITATTTASPGFPHRLEFYGTKGGIQIEGEAIRRWDSSDADPAGRETAEPPAPSDAGAGGDPRGIAPTGHISILQDLILAVREDRDPMVPGEQGRRSLATVLQIYQAAGLV
jgi:predicted dehydrogenase